MKNQRENSDLGIDPEDLTEKYVIASMNRNKANMRGNYEEERGEEERALRLKEALKKTGLDEEEIRLIILKESLRLEGLCQDALVGVTDLKPEMYDSLGAIKEVIARYKK